MKPITVWNLYSKATGNYEHNHISDGHETGDTPTPKLDSDGKPFKSQTGWAVQKWEKVHANLTDEGKIV